MSQILQDVKILPLGKNINIAVCGEHTFGTDAILLADFANIKRKDKACDLGTGCGIIPLLWCKNEVSSILAIDIQQKAHELLKYSIELNSISNLKPLCADLRNLPKELEFGRFDLVTMNPPYKPVGTGIQSMSEAEKIARHEVMCSLEDLAQCANKLLKFGGRLCLCHRPERLCDIIVALRNRGIEVKKIRFVAKNEGKQPWLVLVEGRKGGKSGLTVMQNLLMKDESGKESEEVKKIFADYIINE
ncbi:MAG: methyltransferase [Clostridia bacterium]